MKVSSTICRICSLLQAKISLVSYSIFMCKVHTIKYVLLCKVYANDYVVYVLWMYICFFVQYWGVCAVSGL